MPTSELRHGASAWAGTLFALVLVSCLLPERAAAAFPGANGNIGYLHVAPSGNALWWSSPEGDAVAALTPAAWPGDADIAFSPDGTRITFERGSDIYAMNTDGSGLVRLVEGETGLHTDVDWIEDYRPPGGAETHEMVKVTTETHVWKAAYDPAFTPDPERVVVERDNKTIVVENLCGVDPGEPETCIPQGAPGHFHPAATTTETGSTHIETLDSRTGARVGDATNPTEGVFDESPVYSADGKLAIQRLTASGDSQIVVIPKAGAAPISVDAGLGGISPNFSPDGTKVAFTNEGTQIFIVAASGGAPLPIQIPSPPGTASDRVARVVYSPDGTRFAFERELWIDAGGWLRPESGIYTMGLDGGAPDLLARNGWKPDWQPLPQPSPPVPPPPAPPGADVPPRTTTRMAARFNGRVHLNRAGKTIIGHVRCGSQPCRVNVRAARLTVRGRSFPVRVIPPTRLGTKRWGKVRLAVGGAAMAALRSAHRGRVTGQLRLRDGSGAEARRFNSGVWAQPTRGANAAAPRPPGTPPRSAERRPRR